ncbi:MAG: DNA polymerase IV [Pirellulaceae bacterium]
MIIHVDMDAFYASIEIRDNPSLAGKPVVVGGSPSGRGVISAASYEARKYGIHSAMSAAQALRLCPRLVFVRGRMGHYVEVSRQIRQIFNDFTTLVEPIALDEAFLDVGGSEKLFGDAISIAVQIKERIKREMSLTASAGVAPNKYLAKLASDLRKPDGLVVVPGDAVQEFLDPLEVSRVWGVGKQTQKVLERMSIRTIGQLRQWPIESLKQTFGINGEHFWRLARGLDSRSVVPERDAKSVSNETTFYNDLDDPEILRSWIWELADQVGWRLRKNRIAGRTLQLKVRYSNFETITRSRSFRDPICSGQEIAQNAEEIFASEVTGIERGIRLVGVGIAKLTHGADQQMTLFDQEERVKMNEVDRATDAIREKFGRSSVTRGSAFGRQRNHEVTRRDVNTDQEFE